MYFTACALFLLVVGHAVPLARAFLLDNLASHYTTGRPDNSHQSYNSYSHCAYYSEYNTLVNLMTHDECMNVDSVFKLLADLTTKQGSGECRVEAIHRLAGHFGSHAMTPSSCACRGVNELQTYNTGHDVGVPDLKSHCLSHEHHYSDLYNQFFQNGGTHHSHTAPACRTHHSLWSALDVIPAKSHRDSSCQKDIIFHLKYAFEKHTDGCTCTALLQLGDTNGCLSANSVWHYLDDLQVKDSSCRQKIQKHMADKFTTGSHSTDDCTCSARSQLVNHEVHKMRNGSFEQCIRYGGTFQTIEADLFSNIRTHGCRNHNYLWTQLQQIHDYNLQNHESHHDNHHGSTHSVDCTQDLIVRAAIQYPTDESDICVCSKVSTTTSTTTTTTTTTAAPPTTTTAPPTATRGTVPTHPPIKFSCNQLAVVEQIALASKVAHPDSSPCVSNAGGSDDAYVLTSCNITSPVTWRKGAHVMEDCKSNTHLIPAFTPVSTFNGPSYTSLGSQPGIFLECYNNGFKMAIQKCDGVPEIVHIENGIFTNDPNNYYVIA